MGANKSFMALRQVTCNLCNIHYDIDSWPMA